MIRRLGSFLIFLILVSAIYPAFGDQSTFRGDPQRTGNVSGTGPASPEILWSEKLTAKGYIGGSAAVCRERIYVSSWPDMSYKGEQALGCLNAGDGSVLWLNPLGGKGGASTPAVSGGLVFAGSWYGELYCLDAETGETLWNRTVEEDPQWWGVASSPLVIDEMLFVSTFSDGTLHVLDLEGDELWNVSTGKIDPYTSPAAEEERVYFAGGDPALYCVDTSSFEILWKLQTNAPITSTPAIDGGRAYFATTEDLHALDAETGEEIWRTHLKGTTSSPAISSGRVYIGTDDASLECLNASDGSLVWSAEVDSSVRSSPLVVGDRVYFGTHKGVVWALNVSDGSAVWTYDTGAYLMSSPSFSDGVLYIGSDDGCLYAFGEETSKVIFEGEVLLGDGRFDATAEGGNVSAVDERTALGALMKASEVGGFKMTFDDSFVSDYGLLVGSIDGIEPGAGEIWMYWVNYPDEPIPSVGPDRFPLEEGDVVAFYLGDRNRRPEESLRVEITTGWG